MNSLSKDCVLTNPPPTCPGRHMRNPNLGPTQDHFLGGGGTCIHYVCMSSIHLYVVLVITVIIVVNTVSISKIISLNKCIQFISIYNTNLIFYKKKILRVRCGKGFKIPLAQPFVISK